MAKLLKILRGYSFKSRVLFLAELLLLVLIPVLAIPISVHANPGEDFTIVVLPDTQYYSEMFPDIFYDQTQWIVDNKDSLNIVYVVHLGDMVENAWDEAEWLNADAAMSLLEDPVLTFLQDGIPYGVLPGNHDEPTSLYNQYFGVDRFQGRSYYGGSYSSTDNENNFTLFSAGGMDFIVINLAYGLYPGADVLNWADNVLKDWPERRAIVVAHSLIRYGEQSAFTYDGSAAYEALKDNPNLFLMLGGHMSSEGIRTDVYNGNTVYSILSNYQIFPNGGDGWLRIMKFSPTADEITFKTYSPWLDSYGQDTVMGLGTTSQDFNLLYDMDEVSIDPPTVVIFQQSIDGYYDAVDTVILEDEADLSHGNNVLVGWDSDYPYGTGQPKYGLIRFDNIFGDGVGQIPVGATIHSATLTYVVDNPGDPADLHEVAIEWQEDATYDTFGSFAGVQTEDYGIYVDSAVGSLTGAKVIDVTDSLAAWAANPSANRGWIFLPTGTDGIDFWTSEHGTINDRPSLTVEYFPPMGTEPPTEPIALSVIASSSSQIDLSWTDSSDNESGFEIELSTDGGITFGLLTTVAADIEGYTHVGLASGSEYCYRVRAINASGESAYTPVECDTTLAGPTVVTFQQDADGYVDTLDTLILEDQAGLSHGNNELAGWDIDYPYQTGQTKIGLIRFDNIFGANLGQIPNGATIHSATLTYVVDNSGDSADFNEVAVDWQEDVTYDSFGGFAGVQAEDYGTYVGSAVGSTGAQVIDVTASLAAWAANPAANRGWIFRPTGPDGVDFWTSEHGTISARPSLRVEYSPPTGTAPPSAPTSLFVSASSSSQVDLSWTDLSDNESGFQIEWSTDGGITFALLTTVAADIEGYTHVGLASGSEYCYRVRAINASGESAYTPVECDTTWALPPAPPSAPTSLSVSASSSSQVDLSWTDLSDNESGFQIEWSTDGGITFALLTTVPAESGGYTHGGLASETEYCYRVRAVNAAGESAYTTVECDMTWADTVPPEVLTIEVRVATSLDDAEERASGELAVTSSDLELVYDGGGNQLVGLRFVGVAIPQGASIVNAYVQFKVDEASSVATSLTIDGQDIDDAPKIIDSFHNLSGRVITAATVLWSPVAAWPTVGEAGPDQRTPDISLIVEEIVNRPGWSSGNSLMIFITGNGERVAESYNGDPNGAPLLHVEYTTGNPANQVPVVDAGAAQTITLPQDTVNLSGMVSDDGLPNPPGNVSISWSLVSGPGTVTFDNASLEAPTAQFSEAGTYVLRLTADDGDLSASDDVTITVNAAANQVPVVDAGAAQTITLPQDTVNLSGMVSDDGLPNPPGNVSISWSLVSGPGTVTFDNASLEAPTAQFSEAGTYVLRLTADDGDLSASDDVTITVEEAGSEVTTVEVRVATSSDDAEERASGDLAVTSSDLELVYDGGNQLVGLRFVGVAIPQGASIVNAYVQFKVDEASSVATSLTIDGQDTDDAPKIIDSFHNLSGRVITAATVLWSPVAAWSTVGEAGPDQRTPDISLIVEEIVNRPGWSSGNSLMIFITGNGERVAESYNGDPNGAPLLHVEYTTGG